MKCLKTPATLNPRQRPPSATDLSSPRGFMSSFSLALLLPCGFVLSFPADALAAGLPRRARPSTGQVRRRHPLGRNLPSNTHPANRFETPRPPRRAGVPCVDIDLPLCYRDTLAASPTRRARPLTPCRLPPELPSPRCLAPPSPASRAEKSDRKSTAPTPLKQTSSIQSPPANRFETPRSWRRGELSPYYQRRGELPLWSRRRGDHPQKLSVVAALRRSFPVLPAMRRASPVFAVPWRASRASSAPRRDSPVVAAAQRSSPNIPCGRGTAAIFPCAIGAVTSLPRARGAATCIPYDRGAAASFPRIIGAAVSFPCGRGAEAIIPENPLWSRRRTSPVLSAP